MIKYIALINNAEPTEMHDIDKILDKIYDSIIVEFPSKPEPLEMIELDNNYDFPYKWKHILKVNKIGDDYEILGYISSFGKMIGNI